MRRLAIGALFALACGGCVASGVKVDEAQVKKFETGKSTYSDVIATLGQPTANSLSSNGMRVIVYSYVQAQARPETFIPIIGPLVGGADARSSMVVFQFDADERLLSYQTTQSQTGAGSNLSSGAPAGRVPDQPRQDK